MRHFLKSRPRPADSTSGNSAAEQQTMTTTSRKIGTCQLCGKARLAVLLKDKLCPKCRRACEKYDKDIPITREGLDRLLDDLDEPTKPRA